MGATAQSKISKAHGLRPGEGQRRASSRPMTAEPSSSIPPGALVGRYRILASVGSGAMGEVYRAEDSSLGRIVALKTLPLDFVGTPDRRVRFGNEGRVMASLSHPNLVQVFDVGEF